MKRAAREYRDLDARSAGDHNKPGKASVGWGLFSVLGCIIPLFRRVFVDAAVHHQLYFLHVKEGLAHTGYLLKVVRMNVNGFQLVTGMEYSINVAVCGHEGDDQLFVAGHKPCQVKLRV